MKKLFFSKSNGHSIKRFNYCHIYIENGHSTDNCIHNGLSKKIQNQSNKYENNSYDQKRNSRKFKSNNNKSKGISLNNTE